MDCELIFIFPTHLVHSFYAKACFKSSPAGFYPGMLSAKKFQQIFEQKKEASPDQMNWSGEASFH